MNWKQFLARHKEGSISVSLILVVSLLSFGTFNSTIIASDDWSYFVTRVAFGSLQPVNLDDRRPFVLVLYWVLASLFGLKLEFYYFFNFLVLLLSALLVYAIVKRVFPGHTWTASLVALTYLIYPVDYSRTWFIMIYIRFWWLVSLGVIWLLLEFAESGKVWIYILAMLGIAIPLGAYEGQFGVILLASVLIAFFTPRISTGRRVSILGGMVVISSIFLIWRTLVQETLFEINDSYVGALQFNLKVLLERYLYGLDIFGKGWFELLQARLKLTGINLIPWLSVYALICFVIIFWLASKATPALKLEKHQKISKTRVHLTMFLTGGVFWIAGYIPIIALYGPSLSGFASRVNLFAIPGAAVMLVSAVSIFATLIANSTLTERLIVAALLVPFILAGIYVERQVHQENEIAWDTQKKIWQGVFETIPNIQDQKSVVIIIPGYRQLRPFQQYPFLSGWEIQAGAQVLYNNPSVSANYYYKDIQATDQLFTKNGFRPIPSDKVIPYKKLIFVAYNPQSGAVTLVDNLTETLSLPFPVNNYTPNEHIISARPSTAKFRWLVE